MDPDWSENDNDKNCKSYAMEGIVTTHQTIKSTITRWQKTGSVRDLSSSGPPKSIPESHYRCIDEAMTRNDELTASALKDILTKKFAAANVQYGVRTIARLRNEFGPSPLPDTVRRFGMQINKNDWTGARNALKRKRRLIT